uniref:Putative ovule protein n=1 Tax=Solanum chacoense TaxID=4108 RepID=A0A0V0GGC0_SOLCH
MLQQQQRSSMQGRKVYSQGANSQRSNDYFNPTVSSIMKKRNNMEPQIRPPRLSAGNSSPRWMF